MEVKKISNKQLVYDFDTPIYEDGEEIYSIKGSVNSLRQKKSVSFYHIESTHNQQLSMSNASTEPIKAALLKDKIQCDNFSKNGETVKPVLTTYYKDDNHIFFAYGNQQQFDKNFQKIFKDGKEIPKNSDIMLENFTFILIDWNTYNLIVIDNRSTSTWKDAIYHLCKDLNYNIRIIPFISKEYMNELENEDLKAVTFVADTIDSDTRHNLIPFFNNKISDINKIQSNSDFAFINKISTTINFSEQTPVIRGKYLTEIIDKKDKFKNLKLEFTNKVHDVLNETVTKKITIDVPAELVPGTKNMDDFKKYLYDCLKQETSKQHKIS